MAEDPTTHGVADGSSPDPCATCGAALAADQRYCLNCGRRRGEPRIDYSPFVGAEMQTQAVTTPPAGQPPVQISPAPVREPSPFVAVAGIALLGLMLLVGVLIGRGNDTSSDSNAAPTVVSVPSDGTQPADKATMDTGGTDTGGGTKTTNDKGGGGGSDKVETTGPVGSGSGSIDDPAVANRDDLQALENSTGEDQQQASQNLPDTIALPGEAPPTDNEEPGGGTGATVIK